MITATVTRAWVAGNVINVIGTLVASGNYATGGDAITISSAHRAKIKSGSAPLYLEVHGITGYLYSYVASGTTGSMKVVISSTGLELAAGGYPAGVTGDSIVFYATFKKFV